MNKNRRVKIHIKKEMIEELERRAVSMHLSAEDYIKLVLIDGLESREPAGIHKDACPDHVGLSDSP